MLMRLILLFVTVPLLELYLLVRIGEWIGLLPTIALVLFTGALGATLARAQGLATWGRFQAAMAQGRLPGAELVEGILILVAGAVLLTPGVLTDVLGFLLLVPALRRRVVVHLAGRLRARVVIHGGPSGPADPRGPASRSEDEEVLDAEYEVRE